jgi:3-phenylpropionate/cinnamic acid dioxygenase small subunit
MSAIELQAAADLLAREARLLDQQRWSDWLALYAPDCEYWVPARRGDESLTEDPQVELSHIYYASRAGLEDRVLRITSGRSAASTPAPRTTHILGSVSTVDAQSGGSAFYLPWATHLFNVRQRSTSVFFGSSQVELVRSQGQLLIQRKKVVLQNDYIPTLLDVYCF